MKTAVTPVGLAGFNVLREARGFKGAEENKKFSIELLLPRDVGLKFVDELQVEANKLHAKELETAKARGKNVRYAPPMINYSETDTGMIRLSFKRGEALGAPGVIDENREPYTGLIRRETSVRIAYRVKPYVMANVFGVTLELLAVQVMTPAAAQLDPAALFGGTPSPKVEKKKEEVIVSDLF